MSRISSLEQQLKNYQKVGHLILEKDELANSLSSERETNNRVVKEMQNQIQTLQSENKIIVEKLKATEVWAANAKAWASSVMMDYKKLEDYVLNLLEMGLSIGQLNFRECKKMIRIYSLTLTLAN